MIDDSFWFPKTPLRGALLASVLAMVVFHQSELFGLMSSQTLILGWFPAQIAYDAAYLLVGVLILSVMYVVAPDPPAEYEPSVKLDEDTAVSTAEAQGED